MKNKIVSLAIISALSFSGFAMASAISQDELPQSTMATSQTSQTSQENQQNIHPGQRGHWRNEGNHENHFQEALKNHPLTAEQKSQIKELREEHMKSMKEGFDKILTDDQKQDLKAYRQAHMPMVMHHQGQPMQKSDAPKSNVPSTDPI